MKQRRLISKRAEEVIQRIADVDAGRRPKTDHIVMGAQERRPIEQIRVGARHRKDFGDLEALAASIRELGLLQAIGITKNDELVFGERRLRACAGILGWKHIDVRVISLASGIAAAEHAENEMRKDFTPSERVAILDTIGRRPRGRTPRAKSEPVPIIPTADDAAAAAGFNNERTARNARTVVRSGVPELVEAMDRGEIAIRQAAGIARLSEGEQRAALAARAQRQDQDLRPLAQVTPLHPLDRRIALLEAAATAADTIDLHGGDRAAGLALYERRVALANRCHETLFVDIEDAWRAQNDEPEGEPEADGKDPKVRAAIEAHRALLKRLSPNQKEEFWDALRMIKRSPKQNKAQRWQNALGELQNIQEDCAAYEDVPEGIRDEDRAERYREIAELDLSELEAVEF